MNSTQIALLLISWLLYFIVHSVTASLTVKHLVQRQYPRLFPAYRLIFNFLALVLLIIPLGLTQLWHGPLLWQWTGVGSMLTNAIALVAISLFIWSLRFYDSSEFIGTRQWREKRLALEDQETLTISPLHRFVRHPWYSMALALIWTRDMDLAFSISATCMTLYFVIGSQLEERKLIVIHGDSYRRYKGQVPGLMPLPWKWISRKEAAILEKSSNCYSLDNKF